MLKTTQYVEKEQDWQNENTRYWFHVDGEAYAMVEYGDGFTQVIDHRGWRVDDDAELRKVLIVTDAMRSA